MGLNRTVLSQWSTKKVTKAAACSLSRNILKNSTFGSLTIMEMRTGILLDSPELSLIHKVIKTSHKTNRQKLMKDIPGTHLMNLGH